MDITGTKIFIIFGLLITTTAAALMPYVFIQYLPVRKQGDSKECTKNKSRASQRRKKRSKKALTVLNCFAGGIFLATSFLELLPEIRESFETFEIRWPRFYSAEKELLSPKNGTALVIEAEGPELMPITEIVITCGLFLILIIEQSAHAWNHWRLERKSKRELENKTEPDEALENESLQNNSMEQHNPSSIRSLLLVATLSVHSLLEGIAIGLQDDVGSVLAIFVAVLVHKSLMAISMGTNLVRAKQSFKRILSATLIFAFMSPIGIAIGLIIKTTGGDSSGTVLVNALLQGIATGTFLYITFFEVLVKEFETNSNRLAKIVAVLVGYCAVLSTFFAHHG